MNEFEKFVKQPSPSIFHQVSKGILAYVAGFAMQKLVENAYDQFLMGRQANKMKTD